MRQEELKLLIETGQLIAQVRSQKELLKLTIAKLEPIFQFEDVGLFIINGSENYHVNCWIHGDHHVISCHVMLGVAVHDVIHHQRYLMASAN